MRFSKPMLAGVACATISAMALGAGARAEDAGDGIHPDATMIQYPDVSEKEIVFVYANDLWLVSRNGGQARKLASPPGQELFPKFSNDGETIAFMGNYEGDTDLYTITADGAGTAFRVTHHPTTEWLDGWTPDGELIFHAAGGMEGDFWGAKLFHVSADGGLPDKYPIPYGAVGAISPDGKWLAYTPHTRDFRTWKRYRGGMATDIWLFNLKTYESRKITDWEGTDTLPMWHDGKVYYLSDNGENHRLNIWSYEPNTGKRDQITFFEDFDVKWPSMGPGTNGRGEIVFQNGPSIYLLDLRSAKTRPVEVTIPGDRPSLRKQEIEYKDFVAGGDISPEGKRAAVEARGEIWSVPADKGITRNLTHTSGVAERDPLWSPDGQWIAYLGDKSGEYEVYVTQSDGKGETKQLTDNGTCYRYMKGWSPDSKKIVFSDKTGAIYLLDVETKEQTHVATDAWDNQVGVAWAHDSKWMAFTLSDPDNTNGVITLYNVESGELTPVTSPMFNSTSPTFDREGKFLYFTSQRNFSPTYSDIDTTYIYNGSGVILAVPLNDDVENPFLAKSDEVEWKTDEDKADKDKDGEDGEKADDADSGDKEAADDEGDKEAKADDAKDEKASDSEEAEDPFADYDTEHPLWGIWEGTAKGLSQMPAPPGADLPDEISVKLTFLVKKDGAITVISEAMGQEDESTGGTFSSGVYTHERKENGITIRTNANLKGDDTLAGTTEYVELGVTLTWELTKTDEEITAEMVGAKGGGGKDKPVEITFEGFEERAIPLDSIDPGIFANLLVNDKNQLMYLRITQGEPPAIKLYDIDDDEKGERNVLAGVGGFTISADGKKIGAGSPGGLVIVDAAPGQSLAKPLDTSMMVGRIDPREEWRQIFNDAWRIQRDFFYQADMHGVDWNYMRDRYGAMVNDAVTREDISYIIRELIAELNVGHAYYFGGDVEKAPSENVGLLGCDFELATTDEGTAYRIKKIYKGAPWDSDARGPLSQPGVDVKEGDFLLEVNGVPLATDQDPWAPFQRMAGKVTELVVSEKPVKDDDARTVLVEPMGGDFGLRYRAWIEKNREYVDYKTGGKVGYIYVPNTGVRGQNELYRQFYGQRNKDGLIIDERWNGGGQIPTRFIELLNRPVTNFWARRDGKDWMWPPDSAQGAKVMLINGLAGSGGDMFPALFRQAGLGKIIGTRTWGGLVGISGNPPLIDGGYTSAPTFGFYEANGTWGIEGHGVDPDIVVEADPALMIAPNGEVADPQLDVAIETVTDEMTRNPFIPPQRPASPDRSGMGVREEDK